MSISTTAVIKDRITTATKGSKIALFIIVRGGNMAIDAVFDNTVLTQKRIRGGCEKYIGSYYGSAGAADADADMRRAI
ncbi:MAG: hypothetical protein GY920_21570 [Aliivibrio sp.]|nr:hypothetical protein [Aliivibrio sp.]MCP4255866.1 hypothetical protein [Candidatus Scalindua sp.]